MAGRSVNWILVAIYRWKSWIMSRTSGWNELACFSDTKRTLVGTSDGLQVRMAASSPCVRSSHRPGLRSVSRIAKPASER